MHEIKKELQNILYVEDLEASVFVVKRQLNNKYNIFVAANAEEAWNMLYSTEIDLILLDIYLGHSVDGISLAMDIRGSEKFSKIPIIAVTAYSFELEEDSEACAYIDGLLNKPFNPEDLQFLINKFLN